PCRPTDDPQLLWVGSQHVSAALGNEHVVLDAHAAFPWYIDPWFDGKDHARFQHLPIAFAHIRLFVTVQAEAMSGAVDEIVAVTGVGDHLARRAVDLLGGDARLGRVYTGFVCRPDGFINLLHLTIRLADHERARNI